MLNIELLNTGMSSYEQYFLSSAVSCIWHITDWIRGASLSKDLPRPNESLKYQ